MSDEQTAQLLSVLASIDQSLKFIALCDGITAQAHIRGEAPAVMGKRMQELGAAVGVNVIISEPSSLAGPVGALTLEEMKRIADEPDSGAG